jgi:SAM-dependent methyltransferase
MPETHLADDLHARVERERERYEEGLKRTGYQDILVSHAGYLHGENRKKIARDALAGRRLERVLEIGRVVWDHWLESNGIVPDETYCINISERELQKGIVRSQETRIKPKFLIMDAHKLEFPNAHFDLVCGSGILHHLDMKRALPEIARVLRPDGVVLFSEPLDNNPVGHLVRRLTPEARTDDEEPFRFQQLDMLRQHFDCEFHFEQLVSVPVGLVSRFVYRKPDNPLMRLAFRVDDAIRTGLPRLGPYFRKVTIVARQRGSRAAA